MTNALAPAGQFTPINWNPGMPAYLRDDSAAQAADSLGAMFRSRAFPRISTADNRFTLVTADGEVMQPVVVVNGAPMAMPHVDLAFVRWADHVTKTWYANAYTADSDAQPDCFSMNGVAPDPSAAMPQSAACASCPRNAFGSAANGKGKACADGQRAAVMLAADTQVIVNGALQNLPAGGMAFGYRLPPMTGKNLAARVGEAKKAGVNVMGVAMRASFVSQGVVDFQMLGYLPEALYKQGRVLAQSEEAERACGLDGVSSAPALPAPPAYAALPSAPAPQPAPVAAQPMVHSLTIAAPQPMAPAPVTLGPPVIQQSAIQPAFAPQPMPLAAAPAPAAPKTRKPRTPAAPQQFAAPQDPHSPYLAPAPSQTGSLLDIPDFLRKTNDAPPLNPAPVPQMQAAPSQQSAIQMPQTADPAMQALLDKAYGTAAPT